MVERIRRVVTGHDRDGKSIFIMDGKAPNILEMKSMPGVALTDLWRTTTIYLVLRGLVEWLSGADNLGARVSGGLSVYMTYAGLLLVLVPLLGSRGLSGSSRGPRRT